MADLRFSDLWDIYSPLLTPTQREITDLYFNLDLTVSEIADAKGISRQGASECIAAARRALEEYEEKLEFSRRLHGCAACVSSAVDAGIEWAERFAQAHPELKSEAEGLRTVLEGGRAAALKEIYGADAAEEGAKPVD